MVSYFSFSWLSVNFTKMFHTNKYFGSTIVFLVFICAIVLFVEISSGHALTNAEHAAEIKAYGLDIYTDKNKHNLTSRVFNLVFFQVIKLA